MAIPRPAEATRSEGKRARRQSLAAVASDGGSYQAATGQSLSDVELLR